MKKIFILFYLSFASCLLFAAPPSVPASNLTFRYLDGNRFDINFTVGGGSSRIVVLKKGSPVSGVPVNGASYNANSVFGTTGTEFTQPGEFVVSKTSWNSVTVTNLEPGTTYYVAVFEYNGTGTSTEYLNIPLTGNQATVSAPTVQASAVTKTAATGNSISLAWTKGNGDGRLVIARKGAAVNATAVDLTNYTASNNFGSGTKIGTDNFVVYKGTGTGITINVLEPNTTYYFAVLEYNGNIGPMYLSPAATFSATTNAGPTLASTAPGFNYIEGSSFTFAVNSGNGNHRLFVMSKNGPVTAVPVNGVTYTASAVFGTPASEMAPGEFVVYAATGNGINITNLEPNTVYYFRVYDYDVDNAGNTYYLTSSYAVKSGSTSTTPTTVATNLKTTTVTGNSATISFTAGNGNYRTVLMKAGSAVDAKPADLTKYSANSSFGSGAQLASGNYFVNWGMNGTQLSVTNLQPGITYHVSVFEYNGYNAPVYSTTGGSFSFTVPLEPTAASTSPWSVFTEGNAFRLVWNNGNGARRVVIAKKGSAVTSKPVDQISYTANAAFGNGQALSEGEYVVYDGTRNEVDLTNLEVGTTYHFAVFEYNVGSNGLPDYLTTTWLATSASTLMRPTTQVAINSVSNLQASQATINFSPGNGTSRIFIMKQGPAVTVAPQDLTAYSAQANFGSSAALISDGNYVVSGGSSAWPFTVYNLQPNTTYSVSAFEYNGSAAPVYLTTSPGTLSFTTPDVPGATTPTTPAASASTTNVDGNKLTLKWTSGNGEKRIVVMRQGSAVDFVPASATSYTAASAFGTGTDLGGGQYIVYNNSGSTVDLTNLSPSATYYFAVYEYNGTGTTVRYLTASPLTGTAATAAAPTTPATAANATTGSGQATISWTSGNGSGRLVVLKEENSVSAAPVNLSVYPASATFKSGSQVALGEYVVYAGSGNSVTVSGLQNKTYHYSIFEYNGSAAPVYNTTAVASGMFVLSSALPVQFLFVTAKETQGGVELNWATAQETNSASFVVERSNDGRLFQPLATVAAAGNSTTEHRYTYTDRTPLAGKAFYRLKQVDTDGKTTYSEVVVANTTTAASSINVYPNPVGSQFRITLPQSVNEGVLTVLDSKGVQVIRQTIKAGQAVNSSRFSSGVYFIRVTANGKTYQTTVMKQ